MRTAYSGLRHLCFCIAAAVILPVLTLSACSGPGAAETAVVHRIADAGILAVETAVTSAPDAETPDSPSDAIIGEQDAEPETTTEPETSAPDIETATPETTAAPAEITAAPADTSPPAETTAERTVSVTENETAAKTAETSAPPLTFPRTVVVNRNSRVCHLRTECRHALKMSEANRVELTVEDLADPQLCGYRVCSVCGNGYEITAELETAAQTGVPERSNDPENAKYLVIINVSSGIFHVNPDCSSVKSMKESNRLEYPTDDPAELIARGHKPCGRCSKAWREDS